MANHIIFSGGKNGYSLYETDPEFPVEFKHEIESLYVSKHIVNENFNDTDIHCLRFAPVNDRYVLSIVYKFCTCKEEKRRFFASVNWLFTVEEIDEHFSKSDLETSFFQTYINKSDEILLNQGYSFDSFAISFGNEKEVSPNQKKMLSAASYYQSSPPLKSQVFLGVERDESMLDLIVYYIRSHPIAFRKHLTFSLGVSKVSETLDIGLVIMNNDLLAGIVSSDDFSEGMLVPKIILCRDMIKTYGKFPEVVERFSLLDFEKHKQIHMLFKLSNNFFGYWQYIRSVCFPDEDVILDSEWIDFLGEDAFLEALENNFFTFKKIRDISRASVNLSSRVSEKLQKIERDFCELEKQNQDRAIDTESGKQGNNGLNNTGETPVVIVRDDESRTNSDSVDKINVSEDDSTHRKDKHIKVINKIGTLFSFVIINIICFFEKVFVFGFPLICWCLEIFMFYLLAFWFGVDVIDVLPYDMAKFLYGLQLLLVFVFSGFMGYRFKIVINNVKNMIKSDNKVNDNDNKSEKKAEKNNKKHTDKNTSKRASEDKEKKRGKKEVVVKLIIKKEKR